MDAAEGDSHRMSLFSRARDIIAANIAELLDRAEDPAKLVRLIISEMEETLAEVRAAAARTIADQKELRRSLAHAETTVATWTEKAELALSRDREDLARAALQERARARRRADQLSAELALLDDTLALNEVDILNLESRLREARARQSAILIRSESAGHRRRMRELTDGPRVENALSQFSVLERRADLAEAEAEVLQLGSAPSTQQDDEISRELAAMRARLSSSGQG
jgi:phage shock protein A